MHLDERAFRHGTRHDAAGPHIGDIFAAVDVSGVLLSAEAWLGLVAAAIMVYATIRIRRYRDDS